MLTLKWFLYLSSDDKLDVIISSKTFSNHGGHASIISLIIILIFIIIFSDYRENLLKSKEPCNLAGNRYIPLAKMTFF